jgi:hypothetical protein
MGFSRVASENRARSSLGKLSAALGDRRWIPKQFLRLASPDDPAILSLLQLLERSLAR